MNYIGIILIIITITGGGLFAFWMGAKVYHQGTQNSPPVIFNPSTAIPESPEEDPDEPDLFNPHEID